MGNSKSSVSAKKNTKFTTKVENYCAKNGISIRKFEMMCCISNGYIGKRHSPSIDILERICLHTNTTSKDWIDF